MGGGVLEALLKIRIYIPLRNLDSSTTRRIEHIPACGSLQPPGRAWAILPDRALPMR